MRQLLSQRLFENGWNEWHWDDTNERGAPAGSGIYLYRMQAQGLDSNAGFTQTRRLALVH